MAGYQVIGPAEKDFDQLTKLVKDKKVKCEGMTLVERDKEGQAKIAATVDSLGRQGTGWTGGVGLIVGLVSPPLLSSVGAGVATGGLIGKFAKRKVESGIESGLGDKLKPGTAAIIAIIDSKDQLAAEQALADSPAKSVAQMTKRALRALRRAWQKRPASSPPTAPCCRSQTAASVGQSGTP